MKPSKLGKVTRRDAVLNDFWLFKEWRNLPYIYSTMVEDDRPLSDEEIITWLSSYVGDTEHKYGILTVVLVDEKPVGWQLARDFQSGIPEVGFAIANQDYWGTGLYTEMASQGLSRLKDMGFTKVRSRTRKDNLRVLRAAPRLGFTKIYENDSEIVWLRDL